jgi:hypothetical protein
MQLAEKLDWKGIREQLSFVYFKRIKQKVVNTSEFLCSIFLDLWETSQWQSRLIQIECPRINGSALTEARYVSLPHSGETSSVDNPVSNSKNTILTVPKLQPRHSFFRCSCFLL